MNTIQSVVNFGVDEEKLILIFAAAKGLNITPLAKAAQKLGVPVIIAQPIAVRRKQFIGMLTMEKNRLQVMPKFLRADIRKSIASLKPNQRPIMERMIGVGVTLSTTLLSDPTQPGDQTFLPATAGLKLESKGSSGSLHTQMIVLLNAMVRDGTYWSEMKLVV